MPMQAKPGAYPRQSPAPALPNGRDAESRQRLAWTLLYHTLPSPLHSTLPTFSFSSRTGTDMSTYDSLHRQCRTLEALFDTKLTAYARLASSITRNHEDLEAGGSGERWRDLEHEVDELLEKVRHLLPDALACIQNLAGVMHTSYKRSTTSCPRSLPILRTRRHNPCFAQFRGIGRCIWTTRASLDERRYVPRVHRRHPSTERVTLSF